MAIPGMNKEAKDSLLLHQFVTGLPELITKQLWASSEVKHLKEQLLMLGCWWQLIYSQFLLLKRLQRN